MTTKTLLITGLAGDITEPEVRSWLGDFGPVVQVEVIRDGNAANPYAVVRMDLSDAAATTLASRLSKYWHASAMVSAWLLHH